MKRSDSQLSRRIPLPAIDNCDGCGACCTEQAALPVHLVGEFSRMDPVSPLPAALAAELRATIQRFERDGWPDSFSPCIWYDPEMRRCKHYEHRPKLCRDTLEPGDEKCREWRQDKGVDPLTRR